MPAESDDNLFLSNIARKAGVQPPTRFRTRSICKRFRFDFNYVDYRDIYFVENMKLKTKKLTLTAGKQKFQILINNNKKNVQQQEQNNFKIIFFSQEER